MIDFFYKSCSNKMNFFKFIYIALVILFAVFIAVLPAVRTYAASLVVGALVGSLIGTAVGTLIGAAGIELIIAMLVGMGLAISIQMIYNLFNDESFKDSFMSAWDTFDQRFNYGVNGGMISLSGPAFIFLYNLVKTHIVDHFQVTVTPDLGGGYPLLNAINVDFEPKSNSSTDTYVNNMTLGTDKWNTYYSSGGLDISINNPVTDWQSSFKLMYNGSRNIILTYTDANYHFKFMGMGYPRFSNNYAYITLCMPMIYNERLYIINGWARQNGTFEYYDWRQNFPSSCYFTNDNNATISSGDLQLIEEGTGDYYTKKIYYTDSNSVKHYLNVELQDGTLVSEFRYGLQRFFYYVLCTECELIDSTDNSSLGNTIGTTTSTVNEYYNTSNDIYYNYYNTISAADTAGTLATGTDSDVKINTSALTSSVAMTDTLTDTAAVTGVESAVTTTTGEAITFSPSVTCMNGINLIRVTSWNIKNKFPFAVVYVLRDAFNVFTAERVTPQFTIPFKFSIGNLYSIDEDLQVDLSSLNNIAAIARWGEAGALGIALAILTKRMLF